MRSVQCIGYLCNILSVCGFFFWLLCVSLVKTRTMDVGDVCLASNDTLFPKMLQIYVTYLFGYNLVYKCWLMWIKIRWGMYLKLLFGSCFRPIGMLCPLYLSAYIIVIGGFHHVDCIIILSFYIYLSHCCLKHLSAKSDTEYLWHMTVSTSLLFYFAF